MLCHSFKGCALPPSLLFHALFLSPIQTDKVASTIFWRANQKIAGLGREILYNIQSLNPTHDPDNHNGVITHVEPDILECEVKWALESITMNKASGGDGIPVELFQILKDDAVKCCTQYASKFGKLSSGHKTGKGQFSFQSQRKAMPKNPQTTAQLHSSHTLVK